MMAIPVDARAVARRMHPLVALAVAGAVAIAAMALAPGASRAQEGETITLGTAEGDAGTFLTDPEGRTLYYFTRDVLAGRSRCTGQCAENWPPLLVGSGQDVAAGEGVSGSLGVIRRGDGTRMAAYRGRPLYRFSGDEAAGDTNGQGLGGVWFVALEDGSSPPDPATLTLASTSGDAGTFLTDDEGRTLYFFANDTRPGRSQCSGDCLEAWPALTVRPFNTVAGGDGVPGVVSLIPTDGRFHVTYDGRPLYYFGGDTEPGDANGHGVNDVWFVAAVDGNLPES